MSKTPPRFFAMLREDYSGHVVCEPRHKTWFAPAAARPLNEFQIARVAADPALLPIAAQPGGWSGLVYYRLHGSPRIYYSAYGEEYVEALARTLVEMAHESPAWCIFDNTADGAATLDALTLLKRIKVG